MSNKCGFGHWLFGSLFGFTLALSFHPSNWGRVSGVTFAFLLAVICISSMGARWRALLFLIIPIGIFVPVTYLSTGVNDWMQNSENTPAQRMGDFVYFAKNTGKSVVLEQKGFEDLESCEHSSRGTYSEECGNCKTLNKTPWEDVFLNAKISVWWLWLAILCAVGFLSTGVYDMRDSRTNSS